MSGRDIATPGPVTSFWSRATRRNVICLSSGFTYWPSGIFVLAENAFCPAAAGHSWISVASGFSSDERYSPTLPSP